MNSELMVVVATMELAHGTGDEGPRRAHHAQDDEVIIGADDAALSTASRRHCSRGQEGFSLRFHRVQHGLFGLRIGVGDWCVHILFLVCT